ncbi:MAG: hypothetical protein QW091_00700 [Candidatus Micrarchaeaceae archaeon]
MKDENNKEAKELHVNPGEPVGMVAAESVGEPGTQMILRTFHFAGMAAAITTTGLPRLIELLDARHIPTTPQITVYLRDDYAKNFEKAMKVSNEITEIRMSDVANRAVENFSKGKVLFVLNKQALKEYDLTASQIASIIKQKYGYGAKPTKNNNLEITIHAKKLSEIRYASTKLMHSLLRGIEGAGKAIALQDKENKFYITTTGNNIEDIMKLEGVVPEKIYTNDIFEIYRVFGIEAARNAIVIELEKLMREQGLSVDNRHLELIADAMTVTGEIKSIGRHGIIGAKESVFAKAAFEETVKHLVNAAAFGKQDNMHDVSENILLGKQVPVGTGMVKLVLKARKSEKSAKEK